MIDFTRYELNNIPLEQIGLQVRPHNSLRRAGLTSVLDVCLAIEDNSVWEVKNIGEKSVVEIIEKTEHFLASYNLTLQEVSEFPSDNTNLPEPINFSDTLNLPDITPISDFHLNLLKNYLGIETVSALESVGIEDLEDFHKLVKRYLTFINPVSDIPVKTVIELSNQVKVLIKDGQLSDNCLVKSTTLLELINWQPTEQKDVYYKIQLLKKILEEESLSDEMFRLISELTDRQKEIFLDNSLHDMTLEMIGAKHGVTRERIRQIINDSAKKILIALNASLKIYICTSFEIAKELGSSLSKESWKEELIKRQILIDQDQNYLAFDILTALIKNKVTSKSVSVIPENVQIIIKSDSNHPIYVINALNHIDQKEFKKIRRIIKFTGGIDIEHAGQILGCESTEISSILKAINFQEVSPGWFTMVEKTELTKNMPIFRAGLIMNQYCGPLPLNSFCDGLRRYISRHYEALAPTEVISNYILNFGFKIDNGIVSYEGNEKVVISKSDSLFIDLLLEKGAVLSFQDIVEYYLAKGFSFPTATLRVMGESPLVEKIEQGFYKLRGSKVSWQDIENAKFRQEDYSRNAEVIYGLDGIIRYRFTIGSWAAGGVLSISRSCQPLPDLNKGWPIFVNNEELGTARRDEYLIWGLSPTFNKLGVKFGDRIELAFDSWNKPRINVRIVEENNG
jgi:predicted DNA-binding protein YlxM (UPF0122 family)